MLGHHWFDFSFFIHHHHFVKLTNMQYRIYLAKSCHTERALAISCTLLVFLKWEPLVPRCLCQSSITAAVVRAIPNHSHGVSGILGMKKTSMWIQVIGYRARDFIFVFVSMQQGRATSHPVLNRISQVLVGFLWKLISTTENKNINIFFTQFWEFWVIIAIYKLAIVRKKDRIVRHKLTVVIKMSELWKKSQNYMYLTFYLWQTELWEKSPYCEM